MRIYYILGSFLNLIVQQTFSNPHNTPFKEWQNWFLSTNLWHFSGRKTFHLFWNIIVHRVFVCVVELGLYYTLFYRFTKVLFTGKCMQIVFLIYIHKKKSCSHWNIYIFSSNHGKWKNATQPRWKAQFCLMTFIIHTIPMI